ncbi:PIR protein [Plasmodium ovale]|uniref:PIR protein n=1 Tax=Plasmodium ovale TaxID=36330 RepID=A0A1D3JEN4_PLAOA|nr:PIR protein [Plasmodium ovale]
MNTIKIFFSYIADCELPADKYYNDLDSISQMITSEGICNSDDKLPKMCHGLKDFCYKLSSNLEDLKKKNEDFDAKKHCRYINFWLQDHVINTVENKNTIICISSLHALWENITDTLSDSIKNLCAAKFFPVSIGYLEKWKKMHDYTENYEDLKTAFTSKENCKEYYCKYIADIRNIYNEFLHVCNGRNKQRCPDFFNEFQKKHEKGASEIEINCKEIYDELGYYKIKVYFGDTGIEEYIEQYEVEHIFSFFEKLIGYSIKYYLSKTVHYSKYIVLPIVLILLFYFFMKKLSFFGSKIAPKADDMRKMWRNVQGITNPASLLNPMKPPGGGNKMGLSYPPK